MNVRVLLNLLVLGGLLLALAGCASSPRSGQGAETEDATVGGAGVPDPNKPRLFFSGGDVQQVRGAALGAAVTQGWKVQEPSGDNSLILLRDLDSSAAEALAPGASRGPLPPLVEVRADFFPRGGGVETQLGAQVITQRGTPKETRQDYTDAYRNELSHSLAMLQTAWHETGPRIAKALPPPGGFKDSGATPEGQVADASAPAPLDTGFTGQNDATLSAKSPVAADGSTVAAADYEPEAEADAETMANGQPEFSSAATWALPAGAAATAAAAAQARASALPPAPTPARVGPAPVVSRFPAANPRLIQNPAPPTRVSSASPRTTSAKGLGGTPATAKGSQSTATSSSNTNIVNVSSSKPVKATPTGTVSATKTKITSGGTVTAKPAANTTATAKSAPAANNKANNAVSKTSANAAAAPSSAAKTKAPATTTKAPKALGTSAPAGTTSKATATAPDKPATKTAPEKQPPAKPTTAGTKMASATAATSTKKAANTSQPNGASKTTTSAKKTNSAKEN